jgi:hypothetical protein
MLVYGPGGYRFTDFLKHGHSAQLVVGGCGLPRNPAYLALCSHLKESPDGPEPSAVSATSCPTPVLMLAVVALTELRDDRRRPARWKCRSTARDADGAPVGQFSRCTGPVAVDARGQRPGSRLRRRARWQNCSDTAGLPGDRRCRVEPAAGSCSRRSSAPSASVTPSPPRPRSRSPRRTDALGPSLRRRSAKSRQARRIRVAGYHHKVRSSPAFGAVRRLPSSTPVILLHFG